MYTNSNSVVSETNSAHDVFPGPGGHGARPRPEHPAEANTSPVRLAYLIGAAVLIYAGLVAGMVIKYQESRIQTLQRTIDVENRIIADLVARHAKH